MNDLASIIIISASVLTAILCTVAWRRALSRSRTSDRRFEAASSFSGLLVSTTDGHGRITGASRSMKELVGIDPVGMEAGGFDELVHPDDRETRRRVHREALRDDDGVRRCTFRLRSRDGRWHVIEEQVTRMGDPGTDSSLECIARDRSDQTMFERQQDRLTYLNELSTSFLESFLVTEDIEGTTRVMVDALGRHLASTRISLIDRLDSGIDYRISHVWPPRDGDGSVSPGCGDEGASLRSERLAWWIEQVRGGVPFFIADSDGRSEEERALCSLAIEDLALVAPILVKGELRLMIMIEDREHRLDLDVTTISTVQTLAHGIARSLERELDSEHEEEFRDKLQRLERTQAIGQLASGVAHDFNNVLFAISGRAQLMSRTSDDQKVREGLEEILEAVADARKIIGNLRELNRRIERRDGSVRVGPEIRRFLKVFRHLVPDRTTLEVDIDLENEMSAPCPSDALHQVLLNLIVNARDAMADPGTIRITAKGDGPEDRPIRIIVEDDGPGIPEEEYHLVCRDFHTSKTDGHGAGLGLGIVTRVVKNHDGTLEFSRSGLGGLAVTIDFPLAESDHRTPETGGMSAKSLSEAGIRRAVIVGNDGQVGDLIAEELRQAGILVSPFGDAESFLEDLERWSDENHPDVLIMDVLLPGRSGLDCLAMLRERGIDTPCIIMTSGFIESPPELPGMRIMRKPFTMDTLHANCSMLASRHGHPVEGDVGPDEA